MDWPILIAALHKYATQTPIDLLYINNSTIGALKPAIFQNLEIHNAQLSGCKIKTVAGDAFKGQEQFLKNLNLQDNDLSEVPVDSLRNLKALVLLDLTRNRISVVPDGAFETLNKLHTLKLSDNNVTLAPESLRGLESSLKNLNLKGTRQKDVPEAIREMKTLAFLDLSQNSIRELPSSEDGEDKSFEGLNSLTALNLERNLIQNLGENAFQGVKKTLSSLSLLNNLLPDFPTDAMKSLKELRVLDIGFNLLTDLPTDSFLGNPSITLLALDGNPLATIPYGALQHLNNTLRGLSLGGRFLHCDCRLVWVIDWIRNGDLQVTSRERNPQFCGSPPRFRDRGFYSIQPEELTCAGANENLGVATVVSAELDDVSVAESIPVKTSSTTISTTLKNPSTTTQLSTTSVSKSTSTMISTSSSSDPLKSNETTTENNSNKTTTKVPPLGRSTMPPWRSSANAHQRPSLVMGYPNRNKVDESTEVLVKNAYRQDNSVIIQWGSETANILGFRVVYRLFGDKSFKQGPPLEASEREFKIKNVPSQECIVVCVVSLEEINVSPDTVPYSQCREVRTVNSATTNMDKITIAASAAICGTIVIAVIVFIAASRRRSRKLHELHHHHQQQKLGVKSGGVGLPIAGLPVNCCAAASPGGPLSSLATLNAFNSTKDWDQVSAYSTHSTQRPRMYSIEQPPSIIQDDMRSHFSSKGKPRSIADGQSQHSFSNHSGRYLANNAFPNNLLASRQDLRQSRQSLAMQSERMSRASIAGITANAHMMGAPHHMGGGPPPPSAHSVSSSTRRSSRPRSRSRDHHHRPSSRYSTAGSTHTLNNYCDNSDNWTDHDMDIYMARNPTTRNGLVPL